MPPGMRIPSTGAPNVLPASNKPSKMTPKGTRTQSNLPFRVLRWAQPEEEALPWPQSAPRNQVRSLQFAGFAQRFHDPRIAARVGAREKVGTRISQIDANPAWG